MAIQTGKGGEMQIVLRVKDDGTAVIEKFGQTAEKEGEKASTNWKKVGTALGAAAAVAVTTAAVMVKSAIDTADATSKTAAKLGLTTEALSGLTYTAKLAGVPTEALNTSLQMMTRNLSEAASGTGLAKDAIKDLGLNAAQLAQMKPEEAIEAIADAMEKVPNQADRVSIAMDIFGRSGADMINVLRGGKEALRAGTEEARRFGAIISSDAARQAEAFNDNIDRLKTAAGGMANTMAGQMLPALVGISDAMVDTAKNSAFLEATAKTLGVTLQGLTTVGLGVANAFEQTGTWIAAGAAAAVAASQGEFSQAREIIRSAAEDIEAMNAEAVASIRKVWSGEAPAKGDAEKPSSGGGASSRSQLAREETAKLKEELAKQLVVIHEATISEEQLLAEKYVKDFQVLEQSLALKLMSQERYDEERQALADTYEQKANEKHANDLIRMAENMEALTESLVTEQELLTEDYMIKQLILDDALMNKLISEQTYYETLAALETQYANKTIEMEKKTTSAIEAEEARKASVKRVYRKLDGDALSFFFGTIAQLMQTENKKQFEIGKKAAIAKTIVDTYAAAMGAFKALVNIPYVGPVMGAIAAAATVAFGLSQVNKIRSQQFSGGGAGGGAVPTFNANPGTGLPESSGNNELPSSQLPPPPASAATAQRNVYVNIESDSGLVSLEWLRTKFGPTFEQAQRDGGIVIIR